VWLTSPYLHPFAVAGSIGIGRTDMAVVREAVVVVTTAVVVREAVVVVTTAVVALVGRS